MSRRSVTNDRYKVEMKGKTRKSAASARLKPGTGTSAPAKKPTAKTRGGLFGRLRSREPLPRIPSTPEVKKLSRIWWSLMGVAILFALAMAPVANTKNRNLSTALLVLYAATLSGALYVQFGPLKRARAEALASTKKGGKGSSGKDGGKDRAKGVKIPGAQKKGGGAA